MNFDGKTAIKETPLRAAGLTLTAGSTSTSSSMTSAGFGHMLFYFAAKITVGTQACTGKLEHSDDDATWSDVPGTAIEMSQALGDGAEGLRTILVSSDAVKQYVRATVTNSGSTSLGVHFACLQFNSKNQFGGDSFAGEVL